MKVKKTIFHKTSPNVIHPSEYIDVLLLDDELISTWIDGYESENNSYEGYYLVEIHRMVEETNEEKEKRFEESRKVKKELKERRYKTYLQLKKEFENEETNTNVTGLWVW